MPTSQLNASIPTLESRPKQPEQAQNSVDKKSLQSSFNLDALTKEIIKIIIVGSGVATSLFPLDFLLQYLHTHQRKSQKLKLADPSYSNSPFFQIPASKTPVLSLATAITLLKVYTHSTQAAMLKNAAITQRAKLLNSEKSPSDEKSELRTEELEEGNTRSNPSLARIASVSGIIGLVDTTLTQYHTNYRTLYIHQVLCKQQNNMTFVMPQPQTWQQHFKAYSNGYSLRLCRNVAQVGGLLTSTVVAEKLRSQMSAEQAELLSAAGMGIVTGFIKNVLDMTYKNQLIHINPQTYQTPSTYSVIKDLNAKYGPRIFARGFSTSALYTSVVYVVVPLMEKVADKTIPVIEGSTKSIHVSLITFFNSVKTKSSDAATISSKSKALSNDTRSSWAFLRR